MQCEDKSHETQIMVSMQVADKNVIDTMEVCLHAHELHLSSFPAIDQE
jgi:hypothetical protein